MSKHTVRISAIAPALRATLMAGVFILCGTARCAVAACPAEAESYYQKGTQVSEKYTARGAPCDDACLEEKAYFYQRATALCEAYPEAHNNLADVYEKLGRYPEAIRHYSQAVDVSPDMAVAYFGLGDVYFHTGEFGKAVAAYDKGLTLHPGDSLALKNRDLALRMSAGKQIDASIIETALGGGEIKTMGPAGIRPNLRLPIYIPFAFDSDTLLPQAKEPLAAMGKALGSILREAPSSAFVIEGHTDAQGTDEYNFGLSKRRAQTIVRALGAQFGLPADRLGIKGYGKTRPFSLGSSDSDYARNRRVEVVRLEQSELGWLTNGGMTETAANRAGAKPKGMSLDAAVFYRDADGRPRRLEDGMTLPSGARYRAYLQSNQASYVYVFQTDTTGRLFHLFPKPESGSQDNRVQARKAVWAPGSDDWFELDRTRGEETIYVVATRERREDIEDLFRRHRRSGTPAPKNEALQELSVVLKTMGVQKVSSGTAVKSAPGGRDSVAVMVDRITRDGGTIAHKISFRHE